MQQDIDIAKAPPHLGAPVPLFEYRSRLKTTNAKLGDNFTRDTVVFDECSNACFPAWSQLKLTHQRKTFS